VLGAIKVAIPIGGIAIPFAMSLMAEYISFQSSLLLFPAITLVSFTMLFLAIRNLKTPEPALAVEVAD
jgi:hypothetical protein